MQGPDAASMRRRYGRPGLAESDLPADPLELFAAWFAEVSAAGVVEPNAMVLATVSPQGSPEARTVLLKGFDQRGLRFFTGTTSAKGVALAALPEAALVFPWHAIERQVRVTGAVERVEEAEVAAYFASRPRESQLGAWASPQSQVVPSREDLDARLAEVQRRFPQGVQPSVPPAWGGYRVLPSTWEFWAGRAGRLHDRLRYRRTAGVPVGAEGAAWQVDRLAP